VVPYYTATFGVGTSLSFLWSGWMAAHGGWRAAFITGTAGSIAGALLMALATARISPHPDLAGAGQKRHPLDFRPVLRNRDALAYGGHCWELFAFRAWLPAYLLFAWNRVAGGHAGAAVTPLSTAGYGRRRR
jgi:MFS family permease